MSSKRQMSAEYNRIGSTVLSNSFNWRSTGRSKIRNRILSKYMACLACSTKCFLAFRKEPDFENKYLNICIYLRFPKWLRRI